MAGEQRAEAAAAMDSLLIVNVSSHGEPAECLLSRLASPQHWTRVCAYGAADRRYVETVGTQSCREQATTYRPPQYWTTSIVPKVHSDATFSAHQLWPCPSPGLREIHHTAIGLVEQRLQELARAVCPDRALMGAGRGRARAAGSGACPIARRAGAHGGWVDRLPLERSWLDERHAAASHRRSHRHRHAGSHRDAHPCQRERGGEGVDGGRVASAEGGAGDGAARGATAACSRPPTRPLAGRRRALGSSSWPRQSALIGRRSWAARRRLSGWWARASRTSSCSPSSAGRAACSKTKNRVGKQVVALNICQKLRV